MNVRSAQAPAGDEERVSALMTGVERLLAERRDAEALKLWSEAAAILPNHPRVLNERARRLAVGGDPAAAKTLLEQVVATSPGHVPYLLSLAAVLRTLGQREEELGVLERALALEPRHVVVLLQKGALLELMSRPRAAAVVYTSALESLPPGARLPPPIAAHVAYARNHVARNGEKIAAMLEPRLRPLRSAQGAPEALMRVDRALERMLGRKRIYTPQPTSMYFPFLQNYEFHPRGEFPWLDTLEAASEAIRDEALGVLAGDQQGLQPYIARSAGQPLDQWRELNHSPRWSAYFLCKDGQRDEEHCSRCPRAAATLAQIPLMDIPGRGPTAFFSVLDAHTHIPPHTGSSNARLIVHLPLIIPRGCRFRVGAETREWRFGEAWVFDDTLEHEAWNDSDSSRAILIFDIWNPQLTPLERDLVREATVVFAEYGQAEGNIPGVVSV